MHIYTDADMLYINVYVYSVYMNYEVAFLDVYSSPTRLKTIDSEVSHEYLIYQAEGIEYASCTASKTVVSDSQVVY